LFTIDFAGQANCINTTTTTSVPKLALHEEEDATGAKTELFLHFLPDSNLA